MLLNQKLTNPDSLTGSIPADPAVQADAAARHRGDVARRVVGLVESEEEAAKFKDFEDDGSSLVGAKHQGCNSIETFFPRICPRTYPKSCLKF